MVRLSIFYDKDKKEQFFMVRGDERYARSTKTVISLGSRTDDVFSFSQNLNVNVLRDMGDGNIVIYDNDEVVYLIDDWNSESNEQTIQLTGLAYEIDHNLQAKYIGNNKCSPSSSNTILLNVPDTHRPASTLTFDNTIRYNPDTTFTKTITLTNELENSSYNDGQDIEIYYDDTYVDTITTSSGTATVSITPEDLGLHTIKAVFNGSDNLLSKTVTQDISVGYKLEALSYPSVQIAGEDYEFKAKLTDFFNTPVENIMILVGYKSGQNFSPEGHQRTDSNGIATIYTHTSEGSFIFYTGTSKIIYSEVYDTIYFTPTVLSASASQRLYKGEYGFIQYNIGSPLENVPISVKEGFDEPEIIYTNNQGIATKRLLGRGEGKQTWIATLGELYNEKQISDFAQYMTSTEGYNVDFTIDGGATPQKFNKYIKIQVNQLGNYYFTVHNKNNDRDYILKFKGLSSFYQNIYNDIFFVNGDGSENIISMPRGETITIRRDAGVVRVYKDDTLVITSANQDDYEPKIKVVGDTIFTSMELIEKHTYEAL